VAAAPTPARIIEKGLVSDRVVIDTVISKYSDHLPLYRQSVMLVNPKAEISYEDIKQAYDDSRNCGYALINLVFLEVSSKQYVGKAGQPVRSIDEALRDFNAQCPSTPSRSVP
ncbi:MAG: hypothetical protein LAP87_28905, partial [Acidobacteriia bacterium]|nr:hypothetical protein [Terriglobia bacterium]